VITKIDMDLRYDDRVLGFHAFINTDRDHHQLARDLQRVAKGPKLDASTAWLEGYDDGAEIWAQMCRDRQIANNFELRYDRRVLAFHIFVNTESDPYHVHKGLLRIARGPRLDACVCWAETYERDDGRKIWGELQKMSVKAASDPNAKSYSFQDP
jgi:hypothetical protein